MFSQAQASYDIDKFRPNIKMSSFLVQTQKVSLYKYFTTSFSVKKNTEKPQNSLLNMNHKLQSKQKVISLYM